MAADPRQAPLSVHRAATGPARDVVAVEEPLEIQVDGEPLAVLMRTPGDDRALVAGFLLTEGVIEDATDLARLAPCADPHRPDRDNVWRVALAEGCAGAPARLAAARRAFVATSSCGVCGKTTLESVRQRIAPHPGFLPLDAAFVRAAGARARAEQPLFRATGGNHGAVVFGAAPDHAVLAAAEDVGRHNAVDKAVGALLLSDALPAADAALWVSGRASFEVVQKALVAGLRALVCVGAPTSLAVSLAAEGRLTLVGFAGDHGRFNVYAGSVTGA